MNETYIQEHYQALLRQRKFNHMTIAALLLSLALLSGGMVYTLLNQKVVVAPTVIDSMFSVTGNRLSASGLEQHAKYFVHLYLDATPDSVEGQHRALMANVHPSAINTFQSSLNQQADTLRRLNVGSYFTVKAMAVDVKQQSVKVHGFLRFSQGPVEQKVIEKILELQFSNQFGKPFIKAIREIAHAS